MTALLPQWTSSSQMQMSNLQMSHINDAWQSWSCHLRRSCALASRSIAFAFSSFDSSPALQPSQMAPSAAPAPKAQ